MIKKASDLKIGDRVKNRFTQQTARVIANDLRADRQLPNQNGLLIAVEYDDTHELSKALVSGFELIPAKNLHEEFNKLIDSVYTKINSMKDVGELSEEEYDQLTDMIATHVSLPDPEHGWDPSGGYKCW